jgi:uncharacterized protein
VPLRVIRGFARDVADRFAPERIILFGSHAYGRPHADSDVDVLVVMPARNELDQAVRIRLAVDYNFSLDLLVRTPKNLSWRLAEGDSFLREIVSKCKVLYAKASEGAGSQGRELAAVRRSMTSCRPYGGADWVAATVERLQIALTPSPPGRPRKTEIWTDTGFFRQARSPPNAGRHG